jgi:hypothetical protein
MLPFPDKIEKIAEPPPPPVETASTWWWYAGAGVLGLILLGLLVWWVSALLRRAAVPAAPVRPEKLALRELKQLQKQSTGLSGFQFGTALSEIVRTYLHRRMGMLARFATTEEILGKARPADQAPPPPLVTSFSEVLEGCDALKFGPGNAAIREELIAKAEAAFNAVNAAIKHHEAPSVDLPPASPAPPPQALSDLPHAPAS